MEELIDENGDVVTYRPILRDRPRWTILLYALAAATIVVALHLLQPFPALTPRLVFEAAIVEGLRPPGTLLPGLWRQITGETGTDVRMLALLGAAASGLFVFLLTLAVRYVFAMLVRPSHQLHRWTHRLAPVLAAGTALMAGLADPVWRSFALFSPSAIDLLLVVASVAFFIRWVYNPRVMTICASAFLLGVLAAETFLALALGLALVYAYFMVWRGVMSDGFRPLRILPTPLQLPAWRILCFCFLGWAAVTWLNVNWLDQRDAFDALGWVKGQVFFRLGIAHLLVVYNASSWPGWTLMIGFVFLPFVITLKLFPRMTIEDNPFPFWLGLTVLASGLSMYFVQGPFASLRFWTWLDELHSVRSVVLLSILSVAATTGAGCAFAVFVFDAFCRTEDRPLKLVRYYRIGLVALAVFAGVWETFCTRQLAVRAMLDFIDRAVKETVNECGDAERLFTDGVLDDYYELESFRRGGRLLTVDFVGSADPYDVYVRQRGLVTRGDLNAAEAGGAVLFRTWMEDEPAKIDRTALQMGLDYYTREGKPAPLSSAFVARSVWTDADVTNASAVAEMFGGWILELRSISMSPEMPSDIRNVYSAISWRLAQMSRSRGDDDLAERLEQANDVITDLVDRRNYERLMTFMWCTPREGLQMALRRTDFNSVRRFAMAVLKTDEKDVWANFGMGMSYISQGQILKAEPYLKQCLETHPAEPAVLNNLSIICRKTKRYREALEYARRAAKALPNSPEVQRSLKAAEKALNAAKGKH